MTKPASEGHNANISDYIKRTCNIMNEQDTLKEDMKELKLEMKEAGVDMKAFNIAIREIRKPLDAATKLKVNLYMTESGQLSMFAE